MVDWFSFGWLMLIG